MKMLNKFLTFLLAFNFVVPVQLAQAVSQNMEFDLEIGNPGGTITEESTPPVPAGSNPSGNPPGNVTSAIDPELEPELPPGQVNCRLPGQVPTAEQDCCVGLEIQNGVCMEQIYVDNSLQECSGPGDCGDGQGCYPQRPKDLFSGDPAKSSQILSQVDGEEIKAFGQACQHPKQCASYSCGPLPSNPLASVCVEKMVCRKADLNEVAYGEVQCGEGLAKDPSGKCIVDPALTAPDYLGVDGQFAAEALAHCQFNIPEDQRQRAIAAIKNLRAFEFTFSTASAADHMKLGSKLKSLASTFANDRRQILESFNRGLDMIETDTETMLSAREKNDEEVSIHADLQGENAQVLTQHELATRMTSGYDTLYMLHRRNLLFQSYEHAMKQKIIPLQVKIDKINEEMSGWSGDLTEWTLDGQKQSGSQKWKRWIWASWRKPYPHWESRHYNDIKNLWKTFYQVEGAKANNASIVNRQKVSEYLRYISGQDPAAVFNREHYLMDPIMPGGLSFTSYGKSLDDWNKCGSGGFWTAVLAVVTLGTSTIFTGAPNRGKQECRLPLPRHLDGKNPKSYASIYQALKPKIKEFYSSFKRADLKNIKGNPLEFVYEPELISMDNLQSDDTEENEDRVDCKNLENEDLAKLIADGKSIRCAKDCIEKPENPGCQGYPEIFEEMADLSFANFLAYSAHNANNYSKYFTHATSWRNILLRKLSVDLALLTTYYDVLNTVRTRQHECLEKVINKVADDINDDADQGGLHEGKNYYDPGKDYNGPTANGRTRPRFRTPRLTAASNRNFSFGGANGSLGFGGSNLDNVGGVSDGGSGGASGDVGADAGVAAMKKRLDEMRKANVRAKAVGVEVDAKEAVVKSTLASMGAKIGASGGFGMSGAASLSGNSAMQAGAGGGHQATLGADASGGDKGEFGLGAGKINGRTGGGNAGKMDMGLAGIGYGAGGGHNSGAHGSNYQDPTGMSDEEKAAMMANYERTRGQYQTKEDDGLFKIISKAYVRSLDRVLTRKKKDID